MALLLVGLGGILGSLARYSAGKAVLSFSTKWVPAATFMINVSGAFLLGIVSGMDIGDSLYLFLADGFLGAFTTFSTFMFEGVTIFYGNKKANAAAYIFCTISLGLAGYFAGYLLMK
ncbi:MAG: fluoride efflux transporter CrcB [Saccharofermentanales bacterium]